MMFGLKRIDAQAMKGFLREYLMVVLGILTALATDRLVVHIRDKHAAEESRIRVESEIRSNVTNIREVIAQNDERLKRLHEMVSAIKDDLHKGMPKGAVNAHIQQMASQGFSVGVNSPTLRHEAWDVVIADQSLTHIDAESLNRFAAAYAAQRDTTYDVGGPLSSAVNRALDAFIDLEFGKAEPIDLLKSINAIAEFTQSAQGNLRALESKLSKAVPAR